MHESAVPGRLYPIAMKGAAIAAAALAILPVLDLAMARLLWSGLPEAGPLTEHALVALAFLAAAVAGIQGKHLTLGAARVRRPPSTLRFCAPPSRYSS